MMIPELALKIDPRFIQAIIGIITIISAVIVSYSQHEGGG